MRAKIFQPSRNAMQSGQANTRHWVLEYEPEEAKSTDALIGWGGAGDMRGQIQLRFDTKEDATAYAERNGLPYTFIEQKTRQMVPKSYSDNFKFDKIE